MGGNNVAPQPVELLLSAWMGCTQATAMFVARHVWHKHGITIQRIVFTDIKAMRDIRGSTHDFSSSISSINNKNNNPSLLSSQNLELLNMSSPPPPPPPSRIQRVEGTITVYTEPFVPRRRNRPQQLPDDISSKPMESNDDDDPLDPNSISMLPTKREELFRILQQETERRCPIANMMMASGCEMNIQWMDGGCNNQQ